MPQLRSNLLLALCAAVAPAQDKLNLGLGSREEAIIYQCQLRAIRAGGGLGPVVASRSGGGPGFAAVFGNTPLRLRLRLDGDSFPGKDGKGPVSTYGLGAEGILFLPQLGRIIPFLSAGAAFQHWSVAQADRLPVGSRNANRIAGRAELGLRLGRRVAVSLGVLVGKTVDDRSTANPYLAATF